MPQQVDYDALAAQHGGTAAAPPAVDYDALAAQAPTYRIDNEKDARGNAVVRGTEPRTAAHRDLEDAGHGLDVIFDLVKGWVNSGPHAVVEGLRNVAGGNFAKGVHQTITGTALTAAPMVAPELIPAALASPLATAATVAAGGAASMAGRRGASALGATPDQADLVGDIAGIAGGASPSAFRVNPTGARLFRTSANPAEASAVAFGEREGVPLDAATKTGSKFLGHVQKRVGTTWAGAPIAETAQREQADALARVGNTLVPRSNAGGAAQTGVSAGESVQGAVDQAIRDHAGRADAAYATVRAAEQQAPIPVNLSGFKQAMKPTYDRLLRESQIGVPMQGGKGRMFAALDRIMQGPDSAGLSDVDSALSDLKALARGAEMPELRTQGQGIAAQAVQQLDTQVRTAAAKAGPRVLQALETGRAATSQKYAVADVRDLLSDEPARVVDQLTASRDTGLARLRAVQSVAPTEVPNVARAYLQGLIDRATAEGGFKRADGLMADWQKLGAETKAQLFPDAQLRQDLNDFFLLAKRIGQNPNPSGTAATMHALDIVTAAPSAVIAKVLYAPAAVKLLTSGVRLSMNPTRAAQAAGAQSIARALEVAGVSVPQMAGATDPAPGQAK